MRTAPVLYSIFQYITQLSVHFTRQVCFHVTPCLSACFFLSARNWQRRGDRARHRWATGDGRLWNCRGQLLMLLTRAAWKRWWAGAEENDWTCLTAAGINWGLICNLSVVVPQVTEEMMEQANEKKMDAVNALGEGVSTPSQNLTIACVFILIC